MILDFRIWIFDYGILSKACRRKYQITILILMSEIKKIKITLCLGVLLAR